MPFPKGSAIRPLVVVELLGPLLQGGNQVAATLGEVLAREGVEIRPGALDQARGMAVGPALEQLLSGHGRDDLLEEVDRIEASVGALLERWGGRDPVATEGAVVGWQRLRESGSRVAVITILPTVLSNRLAAATGIEVESWQWVHAGDGRGLPHPDRLLEWFEGRLPADQVTALVESAAAALAATAAGCGEVIAVGGGGARMLAQRSIERLETGDWKLET